MLQGLGFSFPTLQGCYKQRASCEEDDLSAELSHLVGSVLDFANFVNKWRNMSDRVSKEMTEVDYIFDAWNTGLFFDLELILQEGHDSKLEILFANIMTSKKMAEEDFLFLLFQKFLPRKFIAV